jgi:hypothetical protein
MFILVKILADLPARKTKKPSITKIEGLFKLKRTTYSLTIFDTEIF